MLSHYRISFHTPLIYAFAVSVSFWYALLRSRFSRRIIVIDYAITPIFAVPRLLQMFRCRLLPPLMLFATPPPCRRHAAAADDTPLRCQPAAASAIITLS